MTGQRQLTFANFTWIDITSPTKADCAELLKRYNFHHLAVEDVLSIIQRPKLDIYDDHLFMVFHLPRYIKESNRTVAAEIDIFLGKDYIITAHREKIRPLDELFDETGEHDPEILTQTSAHLLYELMDKLFESCFPMLDRIGEKLDRIEDEVYEHHSQKTLEQIALVECDIINFRRIINPQRYAIKDLENIKSRYIGEDLDVYFDDILDKIERIWDMLDNYKEVSNVLQRTSESIITHKLNDIMKILTVFSALMLPLSVVTGFYGMNVVGLPIADHRLASELIIGMLLLIVIAMLFFFKRKKWL